MSLGNEESSRVIAHMNRDHPDSLLHYLEHFGGIKGASSPKITEFTSAAMTIDYRSASGARKSWKLTFDPPMQAGQPRKRLEEMHTEAKRSLGYSDVTINKFNLDKSGTMQLLALLAMEILIIMTPAERIVARLPALSNKVVRPILERTGIAVTQTNVASGLKYGLLGAWFGAHALEVLFCLLPIMRRHGTTDPTVRLQWIVATFIGGFPIWTNFKRTEKLERKAR